MIRGIIIASVVIPKIVKKVSFSYEMTKWEQEQKAGIRNEAREQKIKKMVNP